MSQPLFPEHGNDVVNRPVGPPVGARAGEQRPTTRRAGDADRDRVCEVLAHHYAAGRLSPDDLDARLNAAVRAETLIELHRLVADLPTDPTSPTAPRVSTVPARRAPGFWRPVDVVALVVALGCLVLGLMAILGLALVDDSEMAVAGFFGGCVAAVGGASVMHLLHRLAHRPTGSDQDD